MTKLILSHVLAVSARTLKIAYIINYREAQTVPDCIRYIIIIMSFAITLNHRPTYLLHISILACVKAEI